jgi:hypothetical protein
VVAKNVIGPYGRVSSEYTLKRLAKRHLFYNFLKKKKEITYLSEKFVHLTARTILDLTLLAVVFVAKEVVTK